jgi:hypothetical protein
MTVLDNWDFRDLAVWIRFARRERRLLGDVSVSESSASETSREDSLVLFRLRFRLDSDVFDATLLLLIF